MPTLNGFSGLKSILETFNKGSSADPREIETQIRKLEQERIAAEAEIKELDAAEPQLCLAEDDNALDALERTRLAARRVIAKATLALPILDEQLHTAKVSKHKADWLTRRKQILEAATSWVVAARESGETLRYLLGLINDAGSAGFQTEINHLPKPPNLFRLDEYPLQTVEAFALAIEHGWNVPAVDPPKAAATAVAARVPPRASAPFQGRRPPQPKATNPEPPQARPLFDDVPKDGERRVKIIRSGYETPDGRQCRNGDCVALPTPLAESVVKRAAGEYADGVP